MEAGGAASAKEQRLSKHTLRCGSMREPVARDLNTQTHGGRRGKRWRPYSGPDAMSSDAGRRE